MSFETIPRADGEYHPEDTIELDSEQLRQTLLDERKRLGMDTSDLEGSEQTLAQRPPEDPLLSGDAKDTLEFEPLDPETVVLPGTAILEQPVPETVTQQIQTTAPLPEVSIKEPLISMRPIGDDLPPEPVSPPSFSSGITNAPEERVRKPRRSSSERPRALQAVPGLMNRFVSVADKIRETPPAVKRRALQGLIGAAAVTGIALGVTSSFDTDAPTSRKPAAVQPEQSKSVPPSADASEPAVSEGSGGGSGGDNGSNNRGGYEAPIVTTDREDHGGNVGTTPKQPQSTGQNRESTPSTDKPEKPSGSGNPDETKEPGNPGQPTKPGESQSPSQEPTSPGGNGGNSGTPSTPGTGPTTKPPASPTTQPGNTPTQGTGGEPSNPSSPGGEQPGSPRPTMTQTVPQTPPPQETQKPENPEPTITPSFSSPAATSQPPEMPTQAPTTEAPLPEQPPATSEAPVPSTPAQPSTSLPAPST